MSEQLLTVKNRTVRYYDQGEPFRKALFFLHGGFGDARLHWDYVMDQLADEYYVISVDLPGYGQSDPLPKMSMDALVAWTKDVLDALGIDQAVMIGQSFGGLIARLFAAAHPSYVPALVLVNGGVIPSVPALARLLARLPIIGKAIFRQISNSTTSRSSIKTAVCEESILTDDFYARVQGNKTGLAGLMRSLTLSPRPEKRIPRIPVLMIWGEEDTITPLKAAETIQANIPGAKLEAIAGCGHLPQLETPEVFVWQVKNFLNNLERTRG